MCAQPTKTLKFMFVASKIDKLTETEEIHRKNPQDYKTQMQCYPPCIECCLGECIICGNDENLRAMLEKLLSNNFIDEITFKRWTNTDRSNLETVVKPVEEFLNDFLNALKGISTPCIFGQESIYLLQGKKGKT